MANVDEGGPKLKRAALIALARGWDGTMAYRHKPVEKKRVPIEELLRWTYCVELPKQPAIPRPEGMPAVWDGITRMGEELAATLDDNRFGVVPDLAATAWPHDDAFRVHAAMEGMDGLEIELPDDWEPVGDIALPYEHRVALIAQALDKVSYLDAKGKRRPRITPRRLLFRHAILGGAPDWVIDPVESRVFTENGKPKWYAMEEVEVDGAFGVSTMSIEVDGFDRKLRIPKPGAYTKTYLDPDPLPGLVGRAEYELWRAALDMLAADLQGMLGTYEAVPSGRSMRPWETPDADVPTVHRAAERLEPLVHNQARVRGRGKENHCGA